MNYCLVIVIIAACGFAEVFSDSVTPTVQCKGKSFDDLQQRIQIVPCGKQKCKLRRGSNITVNFRFKPEYEVRTLTNEVNANIAGIPLPFIGVTGSSACGQVSRADDGTAAPCPLQAGQEYTYTNVFPIEQFYPKTDMIVHWNIESDKGSVICFEVPAVITDAKKHGK